MEKSDNSHPMKPEDTTPSSHPPDSPAFDPVGASTDPELRPISTEDRAHSAQTQVEHHLVAFEPDDPENPKNWSKAYKWYCTMVVALTCFVVALASSVITPDIEGVQKEFGVSREAALLSITVFVVGFGVGPMAFAPLSEVYGRRII